MKTKLLKWNFVFGMLLIFMLSGCFLIGDNTKASAATRKCYTISSGNTTVYSNTGLTRKYGSIYGTDEIKVITVTSRYSKVNYPISGGRTKTGYIPTSAILTATSGITKKSSGNFVTYRRNNTGISYGYVETNDNVMILGTSGSFTQIKYPVSGGYKYAFAATSDVNHYLYGITGQTVANGTYKLVSALNSNYVMDVYDGSSASSANIQLYQDNGTNAQKFTFTYQSDGYYTIKNVGSGKVLDCEGAGWTNGTNIQQYTSNSTAAQRWQLISLGNGYYTLKCKCNGLVADVSGGIVANCQNIQMYESNSTSAQKWKLVSVSSSEPTTSIYSSSTATRMVSYELSQLGIGDYRGNNNVKYNTWYWGRTINGSGYAWCMAFQAYCCKQITGSNAAIPKTASCTSAVNIFKSRGQFQYSRAYGGNYTPKAGDLVFYTSNRGSTSCHVGMIISSPVNGYLQTVEGNILCSDGNWKVVKFTKNAKRSIYNSYVLGYATPNY